MRHQPPKPRQDAAAPGGRGGVGWVGLAGLAAAMVAALLVLAWLPWGAHPSLQPEPTLAPPPAPARATAEPSKAIAAAAATAPAATPRPASPAAPEPGLVEVCGFGAVRLPSDDPNPLQRIPLAQRLAALEQAEARLGASALPAVRGAGLLIGARARLPGARAGVQQLARLAAGSQDPALYSLALRACRSWADAENGNCGLLSRAQWARLEPDNLQPWLALAAEAAARDDDEAEATAMRQAALARHSDERAGLLPALVAQGLAHAPPLPRALAHSLARSLQDGWTLTRSSHAEAWCSADALADASRRPTCEAVAETLALHSTSLADVQSALMIGRHLGWPAERLRALAQEQQAIAMLADGGADGSPSAAMQGLDFSCERLARRESWSRQVGSRGELQVLRERAARVPLAPAPR
ncbi:MAG: hypothetical protein HY855_15290 [Burkholderiales bacterium]|nr:hypothetical protein [Burkholderiales bacterium]